LRTERLERAGGVVAAAVEAAVDDVLDPSAQGKEERCDDEPPANEENSA
jgi:hypothetical protein